MTERLDDRLWKLGWTGHEDEQLRRLARLPFAEKLRWLEEGQRVAQWLTRSGPQVETNRASVADVGGEYPDLERAGL